MGHSTMKVLFALTLVAVCLVAAADKKFCEDEWVQQYCGKVVVSSDDSVAEMTNLQKFVNKACPAACKLDSDRTNNMDKAKNKKKNNKKKNNKKKNKKTDKKKTDKKKPGKKKTDKKKTDKKKTDKKAAKKKDEKKKDEKKKDEKKKTDKKKTDKKKDETKK